MKRGLPCASAPTFSAWKPSTSFAGAIASSTAVFVEVPRQRQLDEDAVDGRVGIQLGDLFQHFGGSTAAA